MTESNSIDRLVFIYNADSGRWSAIVDSAKKLLTVNGCALCSITHGLSGEKSDWKTCRDELGVPIDYVHRDEVDDGLREIVGDQLPAVIAICGGRKVVLLSPEVLDRCRGSVADFKGRLSTYASMNGLAFPRVPLTATAS